MAARWTGRSALSRAEGSGVEDLLDLTPPGLDELIAVSSLLDAIFGEGGEGGEAGEPAHGPGDRGQRLHRPRPAPAGNAGAGPLVGPLPPPRCCSSTGKPWAWEISRPGSWISPEPEAPPGAALLDPDRTRFVVVTRRRPAAPPRDGSACSPLSGSWGSRAGGGDQRRCSSRPRRSRPISQGALRYHRGSRHVPAAPRRADAGGLGPGLDHDLMSSATYLYCLVRHSASLRSAEPRPVCPAWTTSASWASLPASGWWRLTPHYPISAANASRNGSPISIGSLPAPWPTRPWSSTSARLRPCCRSSSSPFSPRTIAPSPTCARAASRSTACSTA